MAARWVKKRDGRIEAFDEARVARAVLRAGRRTVSTEEGELLAREIARSVALFLSKRPERAPETSLVAQAMEAALEETGHSAIAGAARDWRDWRRRRSAEVRVRETALRSEAEVASVEVVSRGAARPWTKQRIVTALTQEASLEREAAEDVARAVEERVFAAGLNQISTGLLRELIDAELFERGFSAQLRRLEVVGVPKPDLERLVFMGQGKAPIAVEDVVLRTALERFALDGLVSGRGATKHNRGDLHLVGLSRPYRMASGAVRPEDARDLEPTDPLAAVRSLIRLARQGQAAYELSFGLVAVERFLAPFADRGAELAAALEVLLDALVAPRPDDVPPAPEVTLVTDACPDDPAARRVVELLVAALAGRGTAAAGVRLVARLRKPKPEAAPILEALIQAAAAGAGADLVLGKGRDLASRGMRGAVATVQVGLVNLAGLALAAGRGERARFSRRVEDTVAAVIEAFHRRHRQVFATFARPTSPLFGVQGDADARARPLQPQSFGDALGFVGLDAALSYLTGEGPADNPRVADLGREVLLEVARCAQQAASRLGLAGVTLEEVPDCDAGIRLAALDLDRYPDARDLLGDAPGWDTGLSLRGDAGAPLADLRVRLWLARKLGLPLVLTRPVLATTEAGSEVLAAGIVEALAQKGTGREARI